MNSPRKVFKANFRVFEAQEFIAALCGLLPDPKRHESIAYGEYSNVVRGKRAKAGSAPPLEEQDPLRIRLADYGSQGDQEDPPPLRPLAASLPTAQAASLSATATRGDSFCP